jgi:hypothetical protein
MNKHEQVSTERASTEQAPTGQVPTAQASNAENYDESMIKCEKINRIIPSVCKSIHQMKMVDKTYELDFNLELAEQLLVSLSSMDLPTTNEEKITYVDEFREHLISGLSCLGGFFDGITNLESLSDEQRGKVFKISAKIVMNQDSIKNIAGS